MSVTIEEIKGAWEILLETEQGWPEWDELDDKRQEAVCKASWEAREEDPGADLIDVLYAVGRQEAWQEAWQEARKEARKEA